MKINDKQVNEFLQIAEQLGYTYKIRNEWIRKSGGIAHTREVDTAVNKFVYERNQSNSNP